MIIGFFDDDVIFVQSMTPKVRQMLFRISDENTLLTHPFGFVSAEEESIHSNHMPILLTDFLRGVLKNDYDEEVIRAERAGTHEGAD